MVRLTVMPTSRANSRRRDVECSLAGVSVATLPETVRARRGFTVHSTLCNNLETTVSSECPYTQRGEGPTVNVVILIQELQYNIAVIKNIILLCTLELQTSNAQINMCDKIYAHRYRLT